jgi:hypothetical protein
VYRASIIDAVGSDAVRALQLCSGSLLPAAATSTTAAYSVPAAAAVVIRRAVYWRATHWNDRLAATGHLLQAIEKAAKHRARRDLGKAREDQLRMHQVTRLLPIVTCHFLVLYTSCCMPVCARRLLLLCTEQLLRLLCKTVL